MEHRSSEAVIVLGGEPVVTGAHLALPERALVIAADSGIDQAHELGLRVDVAVGDFDSVTRQGLERVRSEAASVEQHPRAKDQTDFELALGAALDRGVERALVVGGDGGRLDHLIANALVMASQRYAGLELTSLGNGGSRLLVVRHERHLTGEPGELVTLLAVNGPAVGVTTEALRYPLRGETLHPGSSRGVSNELLSSEARISLTSGVLLAVLPGPGHRDPNQ